MLIVHVDETVLSFRLPTEGEVTLGRASDADVRIPHPSVSRTHAVLKMGPRLRIRDVGSANGTRVAGKLVTPETDVEVAVGDAIAVGAAMVLIQRPTTALPPRRVQSHDYFEARVEEECARRSRQGGAFAVVRLNVRGDLDEARVQELMARGLRASDVLALYAPQQYEILLDGAASEVAREITERLREDLFVKGVQVRTGIASYPGDGATAGALFAHANDLVRGRDSQMFEEGAPELPPATAMEGVRELIGRIAASTISVLILGETGVGKEVLAEMVHRRSPRASKPFLRLNCAALSDSLLESELFGHERGAFTGAVAQKRGLLETANGGTVFLDEVGEMPLSTQVKLLRVIEERMVTRVGGLAPKSLDVRFVAATNRDLEAEVARGTFRQDLFFRLNGISIVVPPLRERKEEIEKLAQSFVAAASRDRPHPPHLSRETMARLVAYSWPGNIRELRNVIERAVLLAGDGEIAPRHLPLEKMSAPVTTRVPSRSMVPPPARPSTPGVLATSPNSAAGPMLSPEAGTDAWPIIADPTQPPPASMSGSAPLLKDELAALERQRIVDALERCTWNQTRAAKMLGMSRGVLMARLDQYGIARPRKRGEP
ncbi:MAG TPA: sigma 54-interacting transcriptional regulator [Polyangiaceae bacterium]|nr:sigma 54-interacting transcriptional regulator [Polyangiaceae bacterium]